VPSDVLTVAIKKYELVEPPVIIVIAKRTDVAFGGSIIAQQ
jgi:hypothetical protein